MEDEPIVALDIEAFLTDAGYDVPASLSNATQALEWLDANAPDVVVLDIRLQDGDCRDVAQRLVERAVPFVVFSGTAPSEPTVDPVFREGRWVGKPASKESLVAAIRDLVSA